MAGKYAELEMLYGEIKDGMAEHVAHLWHQWDNERRNSVEEWKELRNYIFATDTSTTTNSLNSWKNSTTRPKLCQLRDNLHSNYISSLLPNDNWLRWIGETEEDQRRAAVIEAYMRDRAHQSQLRDVLSQLLLDYIDFGMCFATVEYCNESFTTPDGMRVNGYEGPKAVRISPYDIVFNITAPTFKDAPKILRSIKTIGEIEELAMQSEKWEGAFEKAKKMRSAIGSYSHEDTDKAVGISVDGFGSLSEYYGSSYVEILTFKGNFYDPETQITYRNQEIIVMDRSILVSAEENDSWFGAGDIVSTNWRMRPDNLYGMGPLINLVGMQYRIDHLENLKADAMDLMVHPPLVIKGDVEPFIYAPEEQISIISEDGEISELAKNAAGVATANSEIEMLEAKMEEFAGAPKQAMGIRTPGEKTAFEVQKLENAAGRIFQEKITNFEVNVLEPLLNMMLGVGRQNFNEKMSLRTFNSKLGLDVFTSITPDDLVARGNLRPIGARHFGEQAQLIQNLSQLFAGPLGQMIAPHWSSENTAKLIQDAMDLTRYGLVMKDKGIVEQAEQQETAQTLQQVVGERAAAPQG
jgi:hypothetical protein